MGARGAQFRREWEELFTRYSTDYPALAKQLDDMQRRQLPHGWDASIPEFPADPKGAAGRDANSTVLNAIAAHVPWLIGGSSDLAPSNKSRLTFDGAGDFSPENRAGRNLHFGVREHAAGAIANGLALSKVRAYQAGFLIFSDFQRGALRLSALMELPVIHLYTHDSIGVGEDGPTHQPVEQLASFRAMPGLIDLRPGDANEVAAAWRVIMPLRHDPVALVLSRQAMPTLDRTKYASADGVANGAYVLAGDPDTTPDVILIATGTELGLAVSAYEKLTADGVNARLVSMPSWELFDRQDQAYRDQVLPPSVTARVAVEQASTFGWHRWVGATGAVIGMSTFGASAPLKALQTKFGFTTEAVAAAAQEQIRRTDGQWAAALSILGEAPDSHPSSVRVGVGPGGRRQTHGSIRIANGYRPFMSSVHKLSHKTIVHETFRDEGCVRLSRCHATRVDIYAMNAPDCVTPGHRNRLPV
jgi:transketolase